MDTIQLCSKFFKQTNTKKQYADYKVYLSANYASKRQIYESMN